MSTRPSQSADIAILVALEKELEAVLRSAGSWERHQTSSDIRTYYTSTTPAGLSVVAARSSGMGQINAALLARDVVALFKPRKVFLVGIAGGLGKEVSLGDIVVSDRIVDYEIGKVTPTGTTPRWSVYGSDALLRECCGLMEMDTSIRVQIEPREVFDDDSDTTTVYRSV